MCLFAFGCQVLNSRMMELPDGKDDSEFWLVKVPRGFDPAALKNMSKTALSCNGQVLISGMKAGQKRKQLYLARGYRNLSNYKKMSVVVTDPDNKMFLGPDLQNVLTIKETDGEPPSVPCHDMVSVELPSLPSGLRQRFVPPGSEIPSQSVAKTKSKWKERKTDLQDDQLPELAEEQGASIISKSRKRKLEMGDEEIPQSKKKRKHENSSEANHVGNASDVIDGTESQWSQLSCAKKHKKRKLERNSPDTSEVESQTSTPKKHKNRDSEESPDKDDVTPRKHKRKKSKGNSPDRSDVEFQSSSHEKHKHSKSKGYSQDTSESDSQASTPKKQKDGNFDGNTPGILGIESKSSSPKKHKKKRKSEGDTPKRYFL